MSRLAGPRGERGGDQRPAEREGELPRGAGDGIHGFEVGAGIARAVASGLSCATLVCRR